jgi:type IV secretion system protein TrbF
MSSITSCGSPAIADYRPTDPQIAWHLARFIENVRSIPADPVIVRQNWLSAYDFVTDKGAVTLNDYARSNDPFTKVRKIQVAVEISSVIAPRQRVFASPGSSDATRTAASPRPSAGRTAILTVVVDTPRDADHAQEPPRCVRPCRQLVEGARLMRSASIVVLGLVTSMLPGCATFKPPQIG